MYNRRATFDGSLFQLILIYITLMLECNPILQTLLDIISFYLFFKENEINVNIPNFCPPVYNAQWGQVRGRTTTNCTSSPAYIGSVYR